MPRPSTFLYPIALLFSALWCLAAWQGLHESYIGATWNEGRVAAVEPGSPAAQAGLRVGDRRMAGDPMQPPRAGPAGSPVMLRVQRGTRALDLLLVPRCPAAPEFTWRASLALAGLAMILLGLWVYRRRPHCATALFLCLSLLLAVILKPSSGFPVWMPEPWADLVQLMATLAFPALLLHFVLVFPPGRTGAPPGPRTLALVYGPALLLLLAVEALQLWARMAPGRLEPWADAMQAVVAIYFLTALLAVSWVFLRLYRSARTAMERSRLRVALYGTVLGLVPVATVSALLIWIPLENMPWIRYVGLSVLLVPGAFADAAVRHRVFDFEVVIKRSLVYSLLAAGSLALYVLLAQVAGHWLSRFTHLPEMWWPATAMFLVGMLFGPVRARLTTAVDRLFLQGRYDYRSELLEVTRRLGPTASEEELLDFVFPALERSLGLSQLAFYQQSNGNGTLRLARSVAPLPRELETLEVPGESRLARWEHAVPWDLDAARWSGLPQSLTRALDQLPAGALVPLRCSGELRGLWVVGRRDGSAWYEPADLLLLTSLGTRCGQVLDRRRLERQAQEQAHLHREMEMARRVQRLLLPAHPPLYPTLDAASESLACEEVGGDYFDFVPQGDWRFGFVIADSSGKGVPAALLMAGLQAQFRAEASRHPQPGELLAAINSRVLPDRDPCRYVSMFYALVDVSHRRIRYSNGGHPPPLLVRADGTIERLESGGMILGVRADSVYEEAEVQLQRGDVLFFYTDGVIEERYGDELFGEDRLIRLVTEHRRMRARPLVRKVLDEVQAFARQPLQDDVTTVALKFL